MMMMGPMLMIVLYLVFSLVGHSYGSDSASVKILVLGRTGSGKSTLINNILGRKIAKVGHRPFPETKTVSVYQEEIHGVSVTVCDTPGLRDASGKEEEYMRKIKASCDDPDLVIFCHSIDNPRWQTDDEEAFKTVTKHLGNKIWKHSVLVLTFADKFVANFPKNEIVNIFKERISDLEQLFKKAIEKIGVEGVGINEKLYSAVSAKGPEHLPGVPNWMTGLVATCLAVTHENGKEGFHQIMLGRLANPHPEDEVPLVWTAALCNIMQKNPVAWTASILGYKAGGYLAGRFIAAKIGLSLGGPAGFVFGGLTGYFLEKIISSATCSRFDNDRDEL